MPLYKCFLVLVCGIFAITLHPALANNEDGEESRIYIAPYAWGLDLDGTVGLNGLNVPLDLQSTELIKGAKSGGMGYLVWDTPDGFFYLEGMQIDFAEKSFEAFFNQGVEASLFYAELGYGRHFEIPTSGISHLDKLLVSPYVGLRQIDLWVNVNGPLLHQKVTADWLDPVIGAVIRGQFSPRLTLAIKTDVSGFNRQGTDYRGIAAAFMYELSPHWSFGLGYRYASFEGSEKNDSDLKIDLNGQGPMVGLIYSF